MKISFFLYSFECCVLKCGVSFKKANEKNKIALLPRHLNCPRLDKMSLLPKDGRSITFSARHRHLTMNESLGIENQKTICILKNKTTPPPKNDLNNIVLYLFAPGSPFSGPCADVASLYLSLCKYMNMNDWRCEPDK